MQRVVSVMGVAQEKTVQILSGASRASQSATVMRCTNVSNATVRTCVVTNTISVLMIASVSIIA